MSEKQNDDATRFSDIENALKDFTAGKMLIVVDDEDR